MSEVKKIEQGELEALQGLINSMNEIKLAIGQIELEKASIMSRYDNIEQSINERRNALEEKYGQINVNLSTGEYEEITEE